MQQVLNSQERNQAFLKFLLFFVITVALVIWAVFYNFNMLPQRVNAMLTAEVEGFRLQENNQKNFVAKLAQADLLLDSLDKKETNFGQIKLQLDTRINELDNLSAKDSNPYGKMNKDIVAKMSIILQDKVALRDAAANEAKLIAVQADLERAKSDIRDLKAGMAVPGTALYR